MDNIGISKLLDIEENVWSPRFGLKGKIDCSIQMVKQDHFGKRQIVAPLELKTGKSIQNLSHRAQTSLYTLLMTDRYSKSFILEYLSFHFFSYSTNCNR
jgi:DNA replication ATP-dependent helicase Dna2